MFTLPDITVRQSAEEPLRESAPQLRTVVGRAAAGVAHLDLAGRLVLADSRFCEIMGQPEGALNGTVLFDGVQGDDGAANQAAFAHLVASGEPFEGEQRFVRRDGSTVWACVALTATLDPSGRPSAAVATLIDITARRQADQALCESEERFRLLLESQTAARAAHHALEVSRAELVAALVDNRRARAEAEAANQAKDRFLAILSHELRTPMTPVVMALHALERTADLPQSARSTLALIQRNVRAELHLIDDLLDVTRIQSGKLEIVEEAADMHAAVRSTAEICEGDFTAKRQRLTLEFRAERHVVKGDSQRLRQAIWNLLKNAAKFTPHGGRVRVETKNDGGRFVLVVSDSGVGIGPEALGGIFEAFAQEGPWVTREFGGLGLGLAIARATVEAHHGTLVAHSEGRDRGATFTIELPLE